MEMNNGISKRAFSRYSCEACIKYSIFNHGEEYLDAKMYNTSEGGMYFESEYDLQPGTDIRIKIAERSPVFSVNRDGYRGEVVWCRRIYRNGGSVYGIGVRFMVNRCDRCGDIVSYSDIQRTDSFLFLCPSCLKHMEFWSGGKVGDSMNKHMIGNVL